MKPSCIGSGENYCWFVEPNPEAEICFRQALDVACRQLAKSLELRAAMSLSRL
jgi:hypothetical protein